MPATIKSSESKLTFVLLLVLIITAVLGAITIAGCSCPVESASRCSGGKVQICGGGYWRALNTCSSQTTITGQQAVCLPPTDAGVPAHCGASR